MMLALVLLFGAHASCPESTVNEDLAKILVPLEGSPETPRPTLFHNTVEAGASTMRCLSEVISPDNALRYHQLESMRLIYYGKLDPLAYRIGGMLGLDPTWTPDPKIYYEEHVFRLASDQAREAWPRVRKRWKKIRDKREDTVFYVDGDLAWSVPKHRPYILQILDSNDQVLSSTYTDPRFDPPPETQLRELTVIKDRRRLRRGLMAGDITSLALAAATSASSALTKHNLNEAPYTPAEIDRRAHQANAMMVASGGLAGVGLVLGVASIKF